MPARLHRWDEITLDKVTEMIFEARPAEPKEQPAFDPDAAIARYLENRTAPSLSGTDLAPRRPQFGRKGL